MPVVSNTSPLQYLHQTDTLFVLPKLFDRIEVPKAVVDEIREGLSRGVSLPDTGDLPWVDVHEVSDRGTLSLVTRLGRGETEVLAVGLERADPPLLLDDRDARRHAQALGLRVTGTLGILILAKERGILGEIRGVLNRLDALRFRLSATTRETALRLAGE